MVAQIKRCWKTARQLLEKSAVKPCSAFYLMLTI